MKKTIAIAVMTVLLSGVSAVAQGTVFFANRLSAAIFAPVNDSTGAPLSGASFSAQLFAGIDSNSLNPIGAALPFRTGAGAGSWAGVDLTIPTVAPGAAAAMRVRAWDNSNGASTYALAVGQNNAAGESALFTSAPLGGGSPPSPSPNIVGNANAANNLTSFNLTPGTIVPEPSVLALGALGGLALLIRRRK